MTQAAPVGYYDWLNFNSPMTDETADRLVATLANTDPVRIVDIGCGWGELLLRLLAAHPTANGLGIDHDEALLERATRNASDRGLASRVTFSAAPADANTTSADATPADLVLNVGAEHVFGDLEHALIELRRFVRPGGRLLLGTQFWETPPTPEVVEEIGDLPTLPALIERATEAGWRPLDLRTASPDDWDRFEFGFLADWEQFVMAPPSADAAERAAKAADEHRAAYLRRRGVLGFAFLTLGLPHPL